MRETRRDRERQREADQTLMIDKKTLEGSLVPSAIWLYRISSSWERRGRAREGEQGRGRGREALIDK